MLSADAVALQQGVWALESQIRISVLYASRVQQFFMLNTSGDGKTFDHHMHLINCSVGYKSDR